MHHIGIAGCRIDHDAVPSGYRHTGNDTVAYLDLFFDRAVKPDFTTKVLEQPHQRRDERAGTTTWKHSPATLQRMDQRVDGWHVKRITADQQRLEAEGLAQMRVAHEIRHDPINRLVALQAYELRHHPHHAPHILKGDGTQFQIALAEHGLGKCQEAAVACLRPAD